jgi:hypothetical protein
MDNGQRLNEDSFNGNIFTQAQGYNVAVKLQIAFLLCTYIKHRLMIHLVSLAMVDEHQYLSRTPHASIHLSKLATDGTSRELLGVAISEETTGVGYDLLDMKASSVVDTLSVIGADKEWSGEAAVGHTAVVWSLGVREGKTRRSSLAFYALVDVCGGDSG